MTHVRRNPDQREPDPSDAPLPRPVPSRRPRSQFRKPPLRLFTTTLWEYPSQHYGEGVQGDKRYAGATPSWIIWQLLERYTRRGDLVVDPMCGSGTTIDVCRDLGRRALGYDLSPPAGRRDIIRADARRLPLEDAKADFVFIDPPYSTHIRYSDDPACIGNLDASTGTPKPGSIVPDNEYFRAMRKVIAEVRRVLRPGRHMALYVSDSFTKPRDEAATGFTPIGLHLFALLCERFEPVDVVCVVRHNAKLQRGDFHRAAEEGGFMLRGFNYLFIMRRRT